MNTSSVLEENQHFLLVPKTKAWLLLEATPSVEQDSEKSRAQDLASPLTSCQEPLLNLVGTLLPFHKLVFLRTLWLRVPFTLQGLQPQNQL